MRRLANHVSARAASAAIVLTLGLGVLPACTQQKEPAPAEQEHDHNHEHEHEHEHAGNTLAAAYTYKLDKGTTYQLRFGHTHEHEARMGFVRAEGEDAITKAGEELLAKEPREIEQKATISVVEGEALDVEMAHYDGVVNVEVPESGDWTLVSSIAAGEALPYQLVDASGAEVAPVYQKVYSDAASQIYKGYFTDEMVKDRTLADYEGDWQSVYPMLKNGDFDEVMAHKAELSHGEMSKDDYIAYYDKGYATDVEHIEIHGDKMTFIRGDKSASGTYKYDGYKILNYKKGNRGVRFLFTKVDGDTDAPAFVQFSDHNIFPTKASHFHIFMGNESQEKLLEEMDNWPTFYPNGMTAEEIAHDMLAH